MSFRAIRNCAVNCVAALLVATGAIAGPLVDEAKSFFEKYSELQRKFDPSFADLYGDTAVIMNTRRYPDGTARTTELSGAAYKRLLRQAMPLAKQRGDTNTYSEVTYKEEDGKARITATRYSELKKYSSPLSVLITKENGEWVIVEEVSESRP